jgi:hypothetical protein
MRPNDGSEGLVVALVWAWLMDNPDYFCSWVGSYTQLRWCPHAARHLACRVGGHWRRLADFSKLPATIQLTCKFERLVIPKWLGTPVVAHRQRWTEEGVPIPRRYRVLVFS